MLHLHHKSKRNVALWFGDAVSNTFSEKEHFLSRILHFWGVFEHFLWKGNTPCLRFRVFRVLSNTLLWVPAPRKNTPCLKFCTFPVLSNTSSGKKLSVFQILHFSRTFRHLRIFTLPNLFFLLTLSFSPAYQQHCQHKE